MTFSTSSELRTLAALHQTLTPLGFLLSQKVRVLDVIRAAAESPEITTPPGTSLADLMFPLLRAQCGPLRPNHPWLQPGDWDYAFKSHFDFVVHAPVRDRNPGHPLFAVEFDGPAHRQRDIRVRDCRKNRLCAASGLPLVRLNDALLITRDRTGLVSWLAELWAAHRQEMPELIRRREEQLASMSAEEIEDAAGYLMMEHPDLDVDLLFRLAHPYPPTKELAARLARRHGFEWSYVGSPKLSAPRWRVERHTMPLPELDAGLEERWWCKARLAGPDGHSAEIAGNYEIRGAYPIDPDHDGVAGGWQEFFAGQLPFLPSGPWMGASSLLGEALCLHNLILEIESWLRANDRH